MNPTDLELGMHDALQDRIKELEADLADARREVERLKAELKEAIELAQPQFSRTAAYDDGFKDGAAQAREKALEETRPIRVAVEKAQEMLARWIVPDSGISDQDVLNELLGILDNKDLIRALKHKEDV